MTAPTKAPFTAKVRDDTTLLLVDDLPVATFRTRPNGDQWLVGLYEVELPADNVIVWCESLEAATKLAEFHARMCARLVAAGVRA